MVSGRMGGCDQELRGGGGLDVNQEFKYCENVKKSGGGGGGGAEGSVGVGAGVGDVNQELVFVKMKRAGGEGVQGMVGGRVGGCETRIEVIVKMKNKCRDGIRGGCEPRIEVIVKMLKRKSKKSGGGGVRSVVGSGLGGMGWGDWGWGLGHVNQ